MIVDASNQILCCDRLLVLRNSNGTCNHKCMLNQRGSDGDYSLNRYIATLSCIGLLTISRRCRKVCIKIRITETPAPRRQVKPRVGRWIRYNMTGCLKGSIKQVSICDTGSLYLPS